jgi:uncharacterized protein (TIGR03437 family)
VTGRGRNRFSLSRIYVGSVGCEFGGFPKGVGLKRELYIAAVALFAPSLCLAQGYIISTVAGGVAYSPFNGIGNGQPATNAFLNSPSGVAVDAAGNIYIADTGNNEVRKVSASTGVISAYAGSTTGGFMGDGGAATSAQLHGPTALALDSAGNLYIADTQNNRIRMVNKSGIITTVAGGGPNNGVIGDGGLATSANLNSPRGLMVDSAGNLYIADAGNNRVRKVTTNGIINTVAGNGTTGMSGMVGDGGAAINASLSVPVGMALDSSGNLYIADSGDNLIRKVTTNGTIESIAGNGESGFSQGDENLAIYSELNSPEGLVVDGSGNIYFADTGNEIIREVTPAGIISTIAGNQGVGNSGDGGPAGAASLDTPEGIALTSTGAIYIANAASGYQDARIRVMTPSSGAVPSITNNGVVSIYSSFPIISPNSWFTIYGTNLAPGTAVWDGTYPIPTQLGGVEVTVDSLPANLWYVSPTQINAQVPNDPGNTGAVVPITVSTAGGTATANISLGLVAPSFSLFSSKYPAAVVFTSGPGNSGLGFDYIGPSGAFEPAFPSRPVMPGEVVVLYGTGFGPSDPTVPAGQPLPASGAAPVYTLPNFNLGRAMGATVNYGGVVAPGLYQFNVVVPAVSSGDNLIQAATNDYTTQNGIYLTVQ